MNETKNKPICCICGKECENEWGNNPWPINKNENARCCDKCNMSEVLSARLSMFEGGNKDE